MLMCGVAINDLELVMANLDKAKEKDSCGRTALIYATMCGYTEIAKALAEHEKRM